MKTLYYVADPMCSWCWGFQPVLEKVKEALPEELSPVYIMGGLARDTDDLMPDAVRAHIQRAWREVAAITGARFNWDFWEKCKPRRCTYPSCRAFYAAQNQGAGTAMFDAIQRAYYQEARNPSDVGVLVALAGEIGLDTEQFACDLSSPEIEQQMQDGFNIRRSMNANQFPGLVVRNNASVTFITRGYNDAETVLARLDSVTSGSRLNIMPR